MEDPRLVNRKKFILEQAKELTEILNCNTQDINWELVAKIGCEIKATAMTAQTLVIKNPTKIR